MTKEELIESASKIALPASEIIQEYEQKRDFLVSQVVKIMGDRSDLDALIGVGNKEMMEENQKNHARFMESIFYGFNPNILVDTILWVCKAHHAHGFQRAYWSAQLDTWVEILKKELSHPAFKAVYPFYHWMIVNIPLFVLLTDIEDRKKL